MMRAAAAGRPPSAGLIRHSLTWLLLLAAVLRLPLAVWPSVHAPDEIYQFIEPAWRLLGHDSIISWEWRAGIRGWTMPALLAGPVAIGHALAPGEGLFVAPRLVAALLSLSLVAAAYALGARISRVHAVVAGFVAAVWFELVIYAPHTLGEPMATAMIVPAAVLLTRASPSRAALAGAGALLALGFVCRFQYAPAIAVLLVGASWRAPARLGPVASGGAVVLLAAGAIDAWRGAVPFGWLPGNVAHNLLHGRADSYGTHPLLDYVGNFAVLWSLALPLLALAIWRGARHAPLLLAMALVNLAVHSLIGHKEPRFIFFSVALLVIVAALGSVDLAVWLRRRVAWHRAVPALMLGWLALSGTLAATGVMPEQWRRGTGAAALARELRRDPALCGLALVEVPYVMLPGRERLAGSRPLYVLDARDPLAPDGAAASARRSAASFNRIVAQQAMAADLPPGFAQGSCAAFYDTPVCIYARSGSCDAGAAAPFEINAVLQRLGL